MCKEWNRGDYKSDIWVSDSEQKGRGTLKAETTFAPEDSET